MDDGDAAAALRQSEPVKVLLGSPARTDFGSAFSNDIRHLGTENRDLAGARDQLRGSDLHAYKLSDGSSLRRTLN